jgi:3-phenylpropionate/trans-cinnamate dioxygenase ferredoxin reductase subunit
MQGRSIVIVGSGQAGLQVAISLRDAGHHGPITLIGDETGLPYQRPALSKAFLLGQSEAHMLALRPAAFFKDAAVDWLAGERAVSIARADRAVRLASGRVVPYDHLVLALGARNRILDVPGATAEGVYYIRTLEDATVLKQKIGTARTAVVVGAGFIGLEFAAVAAKLGLGVTVVEAVDRLMGRAVSTDISAYFKTLHEAKGTTFRLRTGVAEVLAPEGHATGVRTTAGDTVPGDIVVIGIGVLPNTELAADAGLEIDNGIVVDDHLETSDPDISALGDCAAHVSTFADGKRIRLESVQNAVDQAKSIATRLAGVRQPYRSVPWFWSDQGEAKLQIAGLLTGHDQTVLRGDPASGRFSVFCFRRGRLLAVESVNRPGDHMAGRLLIGNDIPLTPEQAADPAFDLKKAAQSARG